MIRMTNAENSAARAALRRKAAFARSVEDPFMRAIALRETRDAAYALLAKLGE